MQVVQRLNIIERFVLTKKQPERIFPSKSKQDKLRAILGAKKSFVSEVVSKCQFKSSWL